MATHVYMKSHKSHAASRMPHTAYMESKLNVRWLQCRAFDIVNILILCFVGWLRLFPIKRITKGLCFRLEDIFDLSGKVLDCFPCYLGRCLIRMNARNVNDSSPW